MKRFCIVSLMTVFFSSALLFSQEETHAQVKAVKKWESEEVFHIPESVFFDKDEEMLYVSNIDGSPVVKDENGYISKLSPEGEVVELKWITGLDAPKGMGKYKGKLYVTDIDQLVVVDVKQGVIHERYPAEGANFLNDIAIDKKGNVYASDMSGNMIYRLKDGKIEKWFENEVLQTPNGLLFTQGHLYIGCRNHIVKLNPESMDHEILVSETGSIDGLNMDEEGNFIISDWYGKVQCVSPSGQMNVLFDTSFETVNAADIYYEESNHMLYVPTFRDGRVMAYEITH